MTLASQIAKFGEVCRKYKKEKHALLAIMKTRILAVRKIIRWPIPRQEVGVIGTSQKYITHIL